MNRIKINRIDIRYGRLVVIAFAGQDWNGYNWFNLWKCKCDCGNEKIISGNHLQTGNTKSCGCLRREVISKIMRKRVGKKHPHYIHGLRCGKYIKEIEELKEEKRKQDNWTCQNCGITQEEYKKKYNRKLDVHHIDGDDTNNKEENMITLCRNCHNKIRINNE